MSSKSVIITGIGSVTPYGTLSGLIPASPIEPTPITAWPTDGLRRAFLVKPFQPTSVVPGLKTRRLDRLSVWALVASSLALQDSGVDLGQMNRSRIAVVFATSFGCIESTEAFYQSAYKNGWSGTDPITFPETLANSPAGHVALLHDLRGPNITVNSKSFAGESALLQAASLLRHGQADVAVVLAGDTLARTAFEWYETAGVLSPACRNDKPVSDISGFVPAEGMVAMVLEPAGRQEAKSYVRVQGGFWGTSAEPLTRVREMLGSSVSALTVCAGDGSPCITRSPLSIAKDFAGENAKILHAQPVAIGLADSGALFHLLLALSTKPDGGPAVMLATSGDDGFATVLFDIL
jgi:3-oxoacyl-[acyl-carrier-protein] synthase II